MHWQVLLRERISEEVHRVIDGGQVTLETGRMREMMIMRRGFPTIDKEQTGNRIRMYMNMRGLTVKDVRDHLQLGTVQSIYHWMAGISLPSIDNLYALSVLFDVPVDWLLCGNYNHRDRANDKSAEKRIRHYLKALNNMAA